MTTTEHEQGRIVSYNDNVKYYRIMGEVLATITGVAWAYIRTGECDIDDVATKGWVRINNGNIIFSIDLYAVSDYGTEHIGRIDIAEGHSNGIVIYSNDEIQHKAEEALKAWMKSCAKSV